MFDTDDFNTRRRKSEFASLYFREHGYFIKDHCFIRKDGRYHVFYIRGLKRGADHWIGHASSADLTRWKVHQPLTQEGAPFVVEKEGTYYLFYNRESFRSKFRPIRVATSRDLMHWTPHHANPVYEPNPRYYTYNQRVKHCRDFHVTRVGRDYYLLFCGLTKAGLGCVGVIHSTDLLTWEDAGPMFTLDHSSKRHARCWWSGYGNPESPFLFKRGNYWHLLFTDNSFSQVYHLWSEKMLDGWSWKNSQKPWVNNNGYLGSEIAATEIVEMGGRQFISYYFYDRAWGTYSLRLAEIGWQGPVMYLKY